MPTIDLLEFQDKYLTRYRNYRNLFAVATLAGPLVMFFGTFISYPNDRFEDNLTSGMGAAFAYAVLVGWIPALFAVRMHKHYLHFSQPPTLAPVTHEFTPALPDQPPVKMTFCFQWPDDFNNGYPIGKDHEIIKVNNASTSIKMEVAAVLNRMFDDLSRANLPSVPLRSIYQQLTYRGMEEAVLPTLKSIAETCQYPRLKYDCVNIVLPSTVPEPEPDFGGVVISTANPPHVIPDKVRNQHVYVPGQTRRGKSTLLFHMALQDMKRGKGVAVLDPKGDLADPLLAAVPKSRRDDCIFLDISNPVPIDVMSWNAAAEHERQTLASDLQHIFLQFSTTKEGDRWISVLQDTIHALLAAKGCTFLDIYHFITSETKQQDVLGRIMPAVRSALPAS